MCKTLLKNKQQTINPGRVTKRNPHLNHYLFYQLLWLRFLRNHPKERRTHPQLSQDHIIWSRGTWRMHSLGSISIRRSTLKRIGARKDPKFSLNWFLVYFRWTEMEPQKVHWPISRLKKYNTEYHKVQHPRLPPSPDNKKSKNNSKPTETWVDLEGPQDLTHIGREIQPTIENATHKTPKSGLNKPKSSSMMK